MGRDEVPVELAYLAEGRFSLRTMHVARVILHLF